MPNPSERDREVARDVLMGTGSISDVDFYRILDRCTAAIAQARAEEREVYENKILAMQEVLAWCNRRWTEATSILPVTDAESVRFITAVRALLGEDDA